MVAIFIIIFFQFFSLKWGLEDPHNEHKNNLTNFPGAWFEGASGALISLTYSQARQHSGLDAQFFFFAEIFFFFSGGRSYCWLNATKL